MKNLIPIICVLFGTTTLAQETELIDNSWFTLSVTNNDDIFTPSFQNTRGTANFTEDSVLVDNLCAAGFEHFIDHTDTSSFFINDLGVLFPEGCSSPEEDNFRDVHYAFYSLGDDSITPEDPFDYSISEENGLTTLMITNVNGETITYINANLSTQESRLSEIQVSYNEETDILSIYNIKETISINVFNLMGQRILETSITSDENIQVNNLGTGIYVVSLKQNSGTQQTFKFVKN